MEQPTDIRQVKIPTEWDEDTTSWVEVV